MINFIIRTLVLIILFCMALVSCETQTKKEIKTTELSFKKEGELSIYKGDSLKIGNIDIEIADNEYERQTGLMYRTSMENNQGMLFIFEDEQPRSFFMKNTSIPLDILFIDSNNRIINSIENAAPMSEESLRSQGPAQYVLELNAGMIEMWKLQSGDRIEFTQE
ncbi:hypothetical protein I215_05430 [Galbibacter marinus]|uniref:DUF192 domain-containing protein n=2 Tax=Galbibacter marinus TaxID=555500 RepID=K2P4L6_9FLAO|nr:hypothetical protein I215_05430 [Galbibacter marinus]